MNEQKAKLRIALGVISGRIRPQDLYESEKEILGFGPNNHAVPLDIVRMVAETVLFEYLTHPLIAIETKGESHELDR